MWSMSGRPCNPGSDFKRLWQAFFGNTPMPQCETPSDRRAVEEAKTAAADSPPAESEANATRSR